MGTVVLNSGDIAAELADAFGPPDDAKIGGTEPSADADDTSEPKTAAAQSEPLTDPDDVEGDDGLTPRQKRDLTQKMQRAIGAKHRRLMEAETFARDEYNRAQMAEERAHAFELETVRLKALSERSEPKVEAKAPVRETFKSDSEFQDALIDWRVDQRLKAAETERQQRLEQERHAEVMRTAAERIQHAKELVPDFDDVVGSVSKEVPGHIAGYMQESEMFAELGYYLGQHPDEIDRLVKLSPARGLVEIGKIESKLDPFAAPKPAKVNGNGAEKPKTPTSDSSSQPRVTAPITPIVSGRGVQVHKDEREMNTREVISDYAQHKAKNLTRRKRH